MHIQQPLEKENKKLALAASSAFLKTSWRKEEERKVAWICNSIGLSFHLKLFCTCSMFPEWMNKLSFTLSAYLYLLCIEFQFKAVLNLNEYERHDSLFTLLFIFIHYFVETMCKCPSVETIIYTSVETLKQSFRENKQFQIWWPNLLSTIETDTNVITHQTTCKSDTEIANKQHKQTKLKKH